MRACKCCLLSLFLAGFAAQALDGTVTTTEAKPIENAYIGLLDANFAPITSGSTDAAGKFSVAGAGGKYLVIQPAPTAGDGGVQVHPYQPRLYVLGENEQSLALKLSPAYSVILEAYDLEGKLVRWQDFEKRGKLGGQFLYATNLNDESIPMTVWPAHGMKLTGLPGGPREQGVPAVLVEPEQSFAVNVLFWPVLDYGKLMLRADNAGVGYAAKPGGSQLVLLNYELARTAVEDLTRRQAQIIADAGAASSSSTASTISTDIQDLRDRVGAAARETERAEQARESDRILRDALKLRDDLEVEGAKARIPRVRQGTLVVQLTGKPGEDFSKYKISLKQNRHDFLFGVFEGSPYNAKAFEAARIGGFELATVLLGWNWTDSPKAKRQDIDKVFGISKLNGLGYKVKAHGVVWMQAPPILPDKVLKMKQDEVVQEALAHQEVLLDVFGKDTAIWEAMNEPANTNVVKLSRETMTNLMAQAAENVRKRRLPTLVNSPHEFSYGSKYIFYTTDNLPQDDYPETFSTFLAAAQQAGKLDNIPILGLQIYPGLHFNQEWGNLQGPAYTPAYFQDTLDRYARFGKALHITEFSVPSSYGADWYNGYWREPWNEETQADFVERIYTLAFAHPFVHSIGWWDIVDDKSSVITGGLIRKTGAPKPTFERMSGLIKAWTTEAESPADANGQATFPAYAGDYTITVTGPGGKKKELEFHLMEGWTGKVVAEVGQ